MLGLGLFMTRVVSRLIATEPVESTWILESGVWDDTGVWSDTDVWKDS